MKNGRSSSRQTTESRAEQQTSQTDLTQKQHADGSWPQKSSSIKDSQGERGIQRAPCPALTGRRCAGWREGRGAARAVLTAAEQGKPISSKPCTNVSAPASSPGAPTSCNRQRRLAEPSWTNRWCALKQGSRVAAQQGSSAAAQQRSSAATNHRKLACRSTSGRTRRQPPSLPSRTLEPRAATAHGSLSQGLRTN